MGEHADRIELLEARVLTVQRDEARDLASEVIRTLLGSYMGGAYWKKVQGWKKKHPWVQLGEDGAF